MLNGGTETQGKFPRIHEDNYLSTPLTPEIFVSASLKWGPISSEHWNVWSIGHEIYLNYYYVGIARDGSARSLHFLLDLVMDLWS